MCDCYTHCEHTLGGSRCRQQTAVGLCQRAAEPSPPASLPRSVAGCLLLALGLAAATASWCSLTAPMHCVRGSGCLSAAAIPAAA